MSTLDLLRRLLNADSLLCTITVEHVKESFYQISVCWPYTRNEPPIMDLRLPNHVFSTRTVLYQGSVAQPNRLDLSVVISEKHFLQHYAAEKAQ